MAAAYSRGSTVPVKFQICNGNTKVDTSSVFSVHAPVLVGRSTGTSSGVLEEVVSTAADANFRYDASSGQWIFNLNTKNLTEGVTYYYEVQLSNGSKIPFSFHLRK